MNIIKVKFHDFETQSVSNPIFIDCDKNKYYWPQNDDSSIKGAHKGFWDGLGCNEQFVYKVTFKEDSGKRIITDVLNYK